MYDQSLREKEGRKGIEPRVWRGPTDIFLRDLEKEARTSSSREAYRELVRIHNCRLGLTAVFGDSDTVEFILVVLVVRSARAASIESALARRGYASLRLDEGWIAHERAVSRGRLGAELRFLRDLVETPEGSA